MAARTTGGSEKIREVRNSSTPGPRLVHTSSASSDVNDLWNSGSIISRVAFPSRLRRVEVFILIQLGYKKGLAPRFSPRQSAYANSKRSDHPILCIEKAGPAKN